MNSHQIVKFLKKLLFVSVSLVVGMGLSQAQNNTSVPGGSQQEIERLEKLLELHRQIQQLQGEGQQGGQGGQQGGRGGQGGRQGRQQGQQGGQQGMQPGVQAPQGSVTLQPENTGLGPVSFSLGKPAPEYGKYALKTNLLYAIGTLTPNLGFEVGLGQRTSLALSLGYNNWGNMWDYSVTGPEYDEGNVYKRKLDHISAKLEFRYWFRKRFEGHFVGAHFVYADYKVGEVGLSPVFETKYFHDGTLYGGGLTYGYFWPWNARWGMEFTLGLGAAVFEYERKRIEIGEDGDGFNLIEPARYRKTYVGPTSAGVTLVFKL